MLTSYLKWSGSKRNALPSLLPQLNAVIEQYASTRLVEPFAGSATVALNVNIDRYMLADDNADLIATHQAITNPLMLPIFLERIEDLFAYGYAEFYALRDRFNARCHDSVEVAALFLYLNKYGFNGLCRYNRSGQFNVSIGKTQSGVMIKKPQLELIHQFREKLHNAEFVSQKFDKTFTQVQPGDVVYCDPPYVPATSSKYNYTAAGFNFDDQLRLKSMAKASVAPVIISNHANDITRELYADADHYVEFAVGRQIACKSQSRQPAMECLAIYT